MMALVLAVILAPAGNVLIHEIEDDASETIGCVASIFVVEALIVGDDGLGGASFDFTLAFRLCPGTVIQDTSKIGQKYPTVPRARERTNEHSGAPEQCGASE